MWTLNQRLQTVSEQTFTFEPAFPPSLLNVFSTVTTDIFFYVFSTEKRSLGLMGSRLLRPHLRQFSAARIRTAGLCAAAVGSQDLLISHLSLFDSCWCCINSRLWSIFAASINSINGGIEKTCRVTITEDVTSNSVAVLVTFWEQRVSLLPIMSAAVLSYHRCVFSSSTLTMAEGESLRRLCKSTSVCYGWNHKNVTPCTSIHAE